MPRRSVPPRRPDPNRGPPARAGEVHYTTATSFFTEAVGKNGVYAPVAKVLFGSSCLITNLTLRMDEGDWEGLELRLDFRNEGEVDSVDIYPVASGLNKIPVNMPVQDGTVMTMSFAHEHVEEGEPVAVSGGVAVGAVVDVT